MVAVLHGGLRNAQLTSSDRDFPDMFRNLLRCRQQDDILLAVLDPVLPVRLALDFFGLEL